MSHHYDEPSNHNGWQYNNPSGDPTHELFPDLTCPNMDDFQALLDGHSYSAGGTPGLHSSEQGPFQQQSPADGTMNPMVLQPVTAQGPGVYDPIFGVMASANHNVGPVIGPDGNASHTTGLPHQYGATTQFGYSNQFAGHPHQHYSANQMGDSVSSQPTAALGPRSHGTNLGDTPGASYNQGHSYASPAMGSSYHNGQTRNWRSDQDQLWAQQPADLGQRSGTGTPRIYHTADQSQIDNQYGTQTSNPRANQGYMNSPSAGASANITYPNLTQPPPTQKPDRKRKKSRSVESNTPAGKKTKTARPTCADCEKNFIYNDQKNDGVLCTRCFGKKKRADAMPPHFNYVIPQMTEREINEGFRPHRNPLNIPGDDFLNYKNRTDEWTERLLEAANTPYADTTYNDVLDPKFNDEMRQFLHDHHRQQQVFYNKKPFDSKQYEVKLVNLRMRFLFTCAIRYHEGGQTLCDIGGDNFGYPVNTSMTFGRRINKIADYLRIDKRIVMDVIEGRGIQAFVADPDRYARRKLENVRSNRFKNLLAQMGKEAKEAAQADLDGPSTRRRNQSTAAQSAEPQSPPHKKAKTSMKGKERAEDYDEAEFKASAYPPSRLVCAGQDEVAQASTDTPLNRQVHNEPHEAQTFQDATHASDPGPTGNAPEVPSMTNPDFYYDPDTYEPSNELLEFERQVTHVSDLSDSDDVSSSDDGDDDADHESDDEAAVAPSPPRDFTALLQAPQTEAQGEPADTAEDEWAVMCQTLTGEIQRMDAKTARENAQKASENAQKWPMVFKDKDQYEQYTNDPNRPGLD